jgi:hypothetical protein
VVVVKRVEVGSGLLALVGCAAVASVTAGCKPNLDQSVSIVTSTRVLAVQASPPEAAPKSMVSYRALIVDPMGNASRPIAQWNYCDARNPLANLGTVCQL